MSGFVVPPMLCDLGVAPPFSSAELEFLIPPLPDFATVDVALSSSHRLSGRAGLGRTPVSDSHRTLEPGPAWLRLRERN